MGEKVAKKDDHVVGIDTHIVLVSTPGGTVPTPMPSSFDGPLEDELAASVFVDNQAVALVGSVANNRPVHVPMGGAFQRQPKNQGKVAAGSTTVFADEQGVARNQDPADCCDDLGAARNGHIIAGGTVSAG
jgi:hypothetical protein